MVESDGRISDFLSRERQALGDLNDEVLESNGVYRDESHETFSVSGSKSELDESQSGSNIQSVNNTEPECIRKWAAEFELRIKAKDEKEREKLVSMEEQGMKDLNYWATQYRDTLSRGIKNSRAHDKELLREQNDAAQASTALSGADPTQAALWERVCQLCHFVSPATEESSGGSPAKRAGPKDGRDLQRMRTLLLQLKQTPPVRRG